MIANDLARGFGSSPSIPSSSALLLIGLVSTIDGLLGLFWFIIQLQFRFTIIKWL